jgi:fluoroacetyl-CoA thioesterase
MGAGEATSVRLLPDTCPLTPRISGMKFEIPVGATLTRHFPVTKEMTVGHFVPGMPEVYGTLMLVLHMEMAAAEAILPYLPEGWVSVGIEVNVTHLAATPVGATVTVTATVAAVGDRDVTFRVESHDGVDSIGSGTHRRAPVEVARFMKRVGEKGVKG